MKADTIMMLGMAAVGLGLLYLVLKNRAAGAAGGAGSESATDGQSKIILTDMTTATGDDTVGIGSEQSAGSERNEAINDSLATGEEPQSGIFSTFADVLASSVDFVSEGPHPLESGQTQKRFALKEDAGRFNIFKSGKGKSGAGFTIFSASGKGEPDTFAEFLPTGSGSTALNIIETGISGHEGTVVAPATLKPGDPGYEANLEAIRRRIQENRRQVQATTIVGGPSTVKIGEIELRGNFAMAKKTDDNPSKSSGSKGSTVTTKTASGKGQTGVQTGRRKVTIRAGDN